MPPARGDPRVDLRPVRTEDLPVFFEHVGDAGARFQAGFVPTDANDREAFDARWRRIVTDPSVVARTIEWNGHAAGHMLLFDLEGQRSVGYWLGREFWGRGIATAALRAFLAEIAERPLFARVVEGNVASIGVLERCGFQRIGSGRVFATARGVEVREWIYQRREPG